MEIPDGIHIHRDEEERRERWEGGRVRERRVEEGEVGGRQS